MEEHILGGKFVKTFSVDHELPNMDRPEILETGVALRANLSSIMSAAAIPVTLTTANVVSAKYRQDVVRRHIETGIHLPPRNDEEAAQVERNIKDADEALSAMLRTPSGIASVLQSVETILVAGLEEGGDFHAANNELLFQSVAATWTAFEIFARDLAIAHLNSRPAAAARVLRAEDVKKRFDVKFTIDDLADNGFDLSAKMGSIIFRNKDFSDYLTIKAFFDALLMPCKTLANEAYNRHLLSLNRERNLIVHKRGVVDERFRFLTGSAVEIGTRLQIDVARNSSCPFRAVHRAATRARCRSIQSSRRDSPRSLLRVRYRKVSLLHIREEPGVCWLHLEQRHRRWRFRMTAVQRVISSG
jgi:hypothetical protein